MMKKPMKPVAVKATGVVGGGKPPKVAVKVVKPMKMK